MTETVKDFLEEEEIKYETIIYDIQNAINYENVKISEIERKDLEKRNGHPLSWYRYHEYDDILGFLQSLVKKYPRNVELIHIGRSYEGRPLVVAKVYVDEYDKIQPKKSKPFLAFKPKKKKKASVFIEAGIHGREWISPAVATWILNEITENIMKNDSTADTFRAVNWFIMPLLNPDGYQFSHSYDRLWRKTRSNHKYNGNFGLVSTALNWMQHTITDEEKNCIGVDPNRNWDMNWNGKGGSHSKCSDYYVGPESFSEPETKAYSKFLMEHRKDTKLFISLHSYGQFLINPAGTNSSFGVNKIDDRMDMAMVAMEALRNVDSSYRYVLDQSNEMLTSRSGSSDMYAFQ